jgi:hypothetical protein
MLVRRCSYPMQLYLHFSPSRLIHKLCGFFPHLNHRYLHLNAENSANFAAERLEAVQPIIVTRQALNSTFWSRSHGRILQPPLPDRLDGHSIQVLRRIRCSSADHFAANAQIYAQYISTCAAVAFHLRPRSAPNIFRT